MENLSISKLITLSNNGNDEAFSKIICLLNPLLNKYSKLLFTYEYDDAYQELTLCLYLCTGKIKKGTSDGECINYIKKSIVNKYIRLKKKESLRYYYEKPLLNLDITTTKDSTITDSVFKLDFLQNINFKKPIHKIIIYLIVFKHLNDREIAEILHVSRQYINHEKKLIDKSYLLSA